MRPDNAYLFLCLIIGFVVLVNVGLIYSLTSDATREQLNLIKKAAGAARNPWKREDEALNELHDRVAALRNGAEGVEDPLDTDRNGPS